LKILKSIRLINFQSHRNTLINLAGLGNLTVITGPSDSGKSAVIRALRLVFYNVPQGIGFIFNAEDKCSVLLTYDDGTTVERIRSRGGINRYVVNGQTLEGFGTGVPLEVQQATGIRKLEIGDQSFLLNLSEQLDGPFLGKSVSGPARAKVLGKLAGTEEIDYAGKEIGTDLYRAKRMQEVLDKGIELLAADIEEFHWIYSREMRVSSAEVFLADTRTKVTEIGKLKTLAQQWKVSSDNVSSLKRVVDGLQAVDKGLDLVRTAQDELARGNVLTALGSSYIGAIWWSEDAKGTIYRLDPVLKIASPMIEMVVEKSTKISAYKALYDRYDNSSISVLALRKTKQRLSGIGNAVDHIVMAYNYNAMVSPYEDIHSRYKDSRLSVLSLRKAVMMLVNIDQAEGHLEEASNDNVRLSTIRKLADQDERFTVAFLHSSREVTRYSSIHEVEPYLDQVLRDNLRLTKIRKLADQDEYSTLAFLLSGREVTRYSSIDETEVYLDQAFKDNLRKLGVIEARGKRDSFAQNITQSLQLFGELTQEITMTESDYLNLMSTLGKCPTCGNDIDLKKLKEAI